MIPLTPPSLIKVLDPAPRMVIFCGLIFFIKKIISSLLVGLKKTSDGPPRLNQL